MKPCNTSRPMNCTHGHASSFVPVFQFVLEVASPGEMAMASCIPNGYFLLEVETQCLSTVFIVIGEH